MMSTYCEQSGSRFLLLEDDERQTGIFENINPEWPAIINPQNI